MGRTPGSSHHHATDFPSRLRTAIKRSGLLKCRIADTVGVSCSLITRWLRGDSEPSLASLLALSRALEVTPDWLTGYAPLEPSQTTPLLRALTLRGTMRRA